jgi:hypothetical protein
MNPSRVVSVHFPKAAGSSLHIQFGKLLGDKLVLDYTHDPLTSMGSKTAEFPTGKTLVHGHLRAQRYASTEAYWMTFLRHPVYNLISIYFFWKTLPKPGHELHGRFLRERPSVLEFATYRHSSTLAPTMGLRKRDPIIGPGSPLRPGGRGLKPSPGFDPVYYAERYPDVAAWNGNRLGHYLEWGRAQGRRVLSVADTLAFPVDGIKSDSRLSSSSSMKRPVPELQFLAGT